ncbi:MAG: hypothetical protein M1831_005395 [Alyxoria varia]|nr:MAG: hypothetical protein M1831_005395 [Alyxoria varia]
MWLHVTTPSRSLLSSQQASSTHWIVSQCSPRKRRFSTPSRLTTWRPPNRTLTTSTAPASSLTTADLNVPPANYPPTVTSLTSTYTTTHPPSPSNLTSAHKFFTQNPRHHIFSTAHFRHFPPSTAPEIALLGRSNVGKSTLLNALLAGSAKLADGGGGGKGGSKKDATAAAGRGKKQEEKLRRLASVSAKPGHTRTMNAYVVGELQRVHQGMGAKSKQQQDEGELQEGQEKKFERWESRGSALVVVDMPGYGSGNATHGLKPTDRQLLELLRSESIPHQIILVKADLLLFSRATLKRSKGRVGLYLPSSSSSPSAVTVDGEADADTLEIEEARMTPNAATKINAEALQKITSEVLEVGDGPPGWRGIKAVGDVITVSGEVRVGEGDQGSARVPLGVDAMRWAILQACGMEGVV